MDNRRIAAFQGRHQGQFLLSDALPVARKLLEWLRGSKDVHHLSLAGSLRRWKEVVRNIDLLASSKDALRVMEHFVAFEGVADVLTRGETRTSVRLQSGFQVDLRVVSGRQFPFALVFFTGSEEHNAALRRIAQKQGLTLSELGIFPESTSPSCKNEKEIYAALGRPYVPPELRENAGELERDRLPSLIGFDSLKGVFHTHSDWSDGTASIEAMAEKARSMGLRYMGLSDHSKAASYAKGLDEARLRKQMEEVRRLNGNWDDFRILQGLECDILPNGDLDLDPALLQELDFLIGSVHSRFEMPEQEMTERVCKALGNNNLDILGHPTGRLLLSREGYKIDLERVIETARDCGKIIELNAYPNRLDLDAAHCRRAKEQGVMLSINPDAHSTGDLENVEYGLGTARRAGLEAKDVLNTRPLEEVLAILKN